MRGLTKYLELFWIFKSEFLIANYNTAHVPKQLTTMTSWPGRTGKLPTEKPVFLKQVLKSRGHITFFFSLKILTHDNITLAPEFIN